jgi:transposase
MDNYAGIDVSLECSSVCVVDASGKIVREGKVASEPAALIGWFGSLGFALTRIGLEAGPLSQWLYAAMREAGLAVELLETRHVRDAFKAMPVKSDRNDARGIAQLMRLGWFRPVRCKSMGAQETRAVLTARKLIQSKLRDVENSLRGILRGFGLKVGKTTARSFAARIRDVVAGHPSLEAIAEALLAVHAVLLREFNALEKRVRTMAQSSLQAKLLMTTPAVGPIVALTYACAIDDPGRFKSSKAAGPDGAVAKSGVGIFQCHPAFRCAPCGLRVTTCGPLSPTERSSFIYSAGHSRQWVGRTSTRRPVRMSIQQPSLQRQGKASAWRPS